jgi:hypothetical protein
MIKYRYVRDDGGFVPGLPKEITDEEAKERGVHDLLMDAVKCGLYEEVKPKKPKAKEE